MDWNWLFSAIAQSTAAIAGIFGAFIVTKILNSQTQFVINTEKLKETIFQSEALGSSPELAHVQWLGSAIDSGAFNTLRGKLDQAKDITELKEASIYYEDLEFSGFSKKEHLIDGIKELIEEKKKTYGKEGIEAYLSRGAGGVGSDYWPNRNRKAESIRSYILKIEHQIKLNRSLHQQLVVNPESSTLITFSIVSILVLFYAGVIYPLSFLPLPIDATFSLSLSAFWTILFSLKGAILTAITVIFTLLLLIFLIINYRLKYSKQYLDKLLRYTQIENYNESLNNMVVNQHLPPEVGLAYNSGEES